MQICKSERVVAVKLTREAQNWERASLGVCAPSYTGLSFVLGSRPLLLPTKTPPLELDAQLARHKVTIEEEKASVMLSDNAATD